MVAAILESLPRGHVVLSAVAQGPGGTPLVTTAHIITDSDEHGLFDEIEHAVMIEIIAVCLATGAPAPSPPATPRPTTAR
ncbi:hypothetical protein [Streptomyces olivoreticuli]|uniref:hypothetical protein n=1 Tax=Streptomyces olivoreticuli TaxID=68246 RepID=UPI000E231DD7|nr:hypothetical protein [Streptomyces olivoreticuli]